MTRKTTTFGPGNVYIELEKVDDASHLYSLRIVRENTVRGETADCVTVVADRVELDALAQVFYALTDDDVFDFLERSA